MTDHNKIDDQVAVAEWENDGGARGSDRPSPQEQIDARHQSDTRGEHRYDGLHQTPAEHAARQERDDLKQRLARRPQQFRALQQRRLVKQGMALWNRSEAAYLAAQTQAEPPKRKTH